MSAQDYQVAAPGSGLLPYPILKFLLTSEPVLGSASDTIPDGPFNRELHKLLQNTGALANLFIYYFSRTVELIDTAAWAVENQPTGGYASTVFSGLPGTLVDNMFHVVYFTDDEVTFKYLASTGKWFEQFRADKAAWGTTVTKSTHKEVTAITHDSLDVTVTIPAGYTMDDLKVYYVQNLDEEVTDIIGVVAGINALTSGTARFTLTSISENDGDYELVTVFEKITVL
jgi:hypothetical protein